MDKFNKSLTAAEFKRNDMRETLSRLQERSSSLLLFSLRWEDLEAHYASLHNVLSRREKEVHALEESVQCRLRCTEERCHELGVMEESMKVLRREIETRECEFSKRARLGFEAKGREMEEKLEVLESVRREIAERLVEIEEKERLVEKVLGDRDREVENREKELEELWKKIEKREAENECRDREFEKKEKELEGKFKLREMEIERRNKELENKEKELEVLKKKTGTKEKEIECRDREFGAKCREYKENVVKLEERLRDVERREMESKIWCKGQFELLEIRKWEVEEKIGNVILDEEKLKERFGVIGSRKRKLPTPSPLPPQTPTPTPTPPSTLHTSQQCSLSYDPMQPPSRRPLPTPSPLPPLARRHPPPYTSQQCFRSYDPMQPRPRPTLPTPSLLPPLQPPPTSPLRTSVSAPLPPHPHPHPHPQPCPHPHPHPHMESHMNGSNRHLVTPHYSIPSGQYARSPGFPPVYPHPSCFS